MVGKTIQTPVSPPVALEERSRREVLRPGHFSDPPTQPHSPMLGDDELPVAEYGEVETASYHSHGSYIS